MIQTLDQPSKSTICTKATISDIQHLQTLMKTSQSRTEASEASESQLKHSATLSLISFPSQRKIGRRCQVVAPVTTLSRVRRVTVQQIQPVRDQTVSMTPRSAPSIASVPLIIYLVTSRRFDSNRRSMTTGPIAAAFRLLVPRNRESFSTRWSLDRSFL